MADVSGVTPRQAAPLPDDAVEVFAQWLSLRDCRATITPEDRFDARMILAEVAPALHAQERERILSDDAAAGVYRLGLADGRAEEREACARLAEQQKELRSASWFADLIRGRAR